MTIMVLHPGRLTALITTIVSVFVVAGAISIPALQVEPKDAFTGVAIYAAVLVVFVGTNTSDKTAIGKLDKAIASGLLGGVFLFLIVWAVINRVHYFRLRSKKRGMSGQTEKA